MRDPDYVSAAAAAVDTDDTDSDDDVEKEQQAFYNEFNRLMKLGKRREAFSYLLMI